MNIDLHKLYDSVDQFFELDGSVRMRLTADTAISCCHAALNRGYMISRIEGGIWHSSGFEARVDCIWDAKCPSVAYQMAEKNNATAAEFIRSEKLDHDAFVLTVSKLSCF